MVLQRIEVAQLRTDADCDLSDLARGAGMVRGQLPALLRDAVAPPARCEDHRRGVDRVPAARAPAVLGSVELGER